MNTIDARHVGLEDIASLHVRRWLELTFACRGGACSLENVLANTQDHPGHDCDATLADQWDLWECCLEIAGGYATAKPR
jgi:hypothetical protein